MHQEIERHLEEFLKPAGKAPANFTRIWESARNAPMRCERSKRNHNCCDRCAARRTSNRAPAFTPA